MGTRTRRVAALLSAVVVFSALSPALDFTRAQGASGVLTPHARIAIHDIHGFNLTNGVTGGSGSFADPFVIEGWSIDGRGSEGIRITAPGAAVLLRNLEIFNASRPSSCCSYAIAAVPDLARIENVTIRDTAHGIDLSGADSAQLINTTLSNVTSVGVSLAGMPVSVRLSGNSIDGGISLGQTTMEIASTWAISSDNLVNGAPYRLLLNCTDTTIADQPAGQVDALGCEGLTISNVSGAKQPLRVGIRGGANLSIRGSELSAVTLSELDNVSVKGNTFGEAGFLLVQYATNLSVLGNSMWTNLTGGTGLYVTNSERVEIVANNITGPRNTPLRVAGSILVQIEDNSFVGGTRALSVRDSTDVSITGNLVQQVRGGLALSNLERFVLAGNTFEGNTGTGATLASVLDGNVSGNRFSGHSDGGLAIAGAYYTTLTGNVFVDDGIQFQGGDADEFIWLEIPPDNLVNGVPIRFYKNCTDTKLNGLPTAQLIVANCTGFLASNLLLNGTEYPVLFTYVIGAALEDSTVRGGELAIMLNGAEETRISGNTVTNCTFGIQTIGAWDTEISGNEVRDCYFGLLFENANGGRVTGNSVVNVSAGSLAFDDSKHISVSGNELGAGGISLSGGEVDDYRLFTIDDSNFVNGKPIRYIANCSDTTVEGLSLGQLIVVNCERISIQNSAVVGGAGATLAYVWDSSLANLELSSNLASGLTIEHSQNISASFINATGNGITGTYQGTALTWGVGVTVDDSSGIRLTQSTLRRNLDNGIWMGRSPSSSVEDSVVEDHPEEGIRIYQSDFSIVRGNRIQNNSIGVFVYSETAGVWVSGNQFVDNGGGLSANGGRDLRVERNEFLGTNGSSIFMHHVRNGSVIGNNITGGHTGVNLSWAEKGRIEGNRIEGAEVGAALSVSGGVLVFHNLFIDNALQATDNTQQNRWNGSPVEGGNYWSDYEGTDACAGAAQDRCQGADGIGDAPRIVPRPPGGVYSLSGSYYPPENATDHYPLMVPVIPAAAPDGGTSTTASPIEMVRLSLLAVVGVFALSAAWLYFTRLHRRPPPGPGEGA